MSPLDTFIVITGFVWVVFLLFIFGSRTVSLIYGAPYIGIGQKYILKLLDFASIGPADHLMDLGCGDGRVLISALLERQVGRATGYEIARWPLLKAWLKRRYSRLEKSLALHRANFFTADLKGVTVVYLYLFPALLQKVAKKIATEAAPGTRLLCPSFVIDLTNVAGLRLVKEEPIGNTRVYLYEVTRH